MASKKFSFRIGLRVGLLVSTIFLFAWFWYNYQLLFIHVFLALVIAGQTAELIYYTNRVNRELRKFLEAIRYGDYSVSFGGHLGGSFKELSENFSAVIELVKNSKAERESHAELLKLTIENLRLGVILVDTHGTLMQVNPAARDLLDIPHFHTWNMLGKKKPSFVKQIGDLKSEGRRLLEINTSTGLREFYLDVTSISLLGSQYQLISFSDLKNEIEKKEIDAWHRLIRILAHEVMNSVTPVTSLSETIKNILTDEKGNALAGEELDPEKIGDIILALNTIIKRSHGMLNFVDEYRKLTQLPAPRLSPLNVNELMSHACKLMEAEAATFSIELSSKAAPKNLAINADQKMIEQVLINLIGNAIHALAEKENGQIHLSTSLNDHEIVLHITDNGHGISKDILPSIFIPFFSTRKNGSGIGLTLSKNIMQLHKGNITVQSAEGEGTEFRLSFGI